MRFSQPIRLLVLAIYVLILFIISKYSLGSWIPPTSHKGLWFYSGLAALLLGNLLVTPFYTKPVDSISYAVAGIVALFAANIWPVENYTSFDYFIWLAVVIYLSLIIISGIFNITLKDLPNPFCQKMSKGFYFITDSLGTPKSIFSAIFLFAIIAFHRDNPKEYLSIGLAWAFLVALNPLETIIALLNQWVNLWRTTESNQPFGEIVSYQSPNIVLIRQYEDVNVSFGDTLIIRADNGSTGIALALDYIGYAEGRWLRAIHLPISNDMRSLLDAKIKFHNPLQVMKIDIDSLGLSIDDMQVRKPYLLGLVSPNSDISQLKIELLRIDLNIEEGRLIEVEINGKPVLYQIVNGLTQEEILQQKNTMGYVQAYAKKIGTWNSQSKRFEPVRWVPNPNAPVFLVESETFIPEKNAIGHFPGTKYSVTIDVHQLVIHNAAILGILGAGKSYLALELVERMIKAKIKVICLDLTNQYAAELTPYYNINDEQPEIAELQSIGPPGKNNFQQNVEEGGSILSFKNKLTEKLKVFLSPENTDSYLKIYNPAQFEVWRQDSKLFNNRASMASITPTEITRLITETALEVLQEQGMSDEAKCCIVFEEAHSLIPEWTSVASEGEKTATNGTAKAILQGRKYGLGCLVITQRTANVTKSILNQCNTIFALRVFDATGMEFLRNYIGEDYAGVLSTLEDRHAIVFGRASSCRNPVLIRLNDRIDFLRIFRNAEVIDGAIGEGE